ncbi:putative glycolipid-binding domain-containing protein [Pelagibacterium sp. H642]|uniref:putative glycolipid-binding domain-containing protein n=1 Tax=Pelagibacterium sp. H642 TaxID=1881069 RepID=UPI002814F892|nr:putative glycolipid-binding domain-containing protein [Pelagibacterium sp. H642]WMT91630.1 putative glycolipid-binding domain-containing protein [Pelagibacterium sp. H642]
MQAAPETRILFWRRTDLAGMERLVLEHGADGISVSGTVICVEDGGFRIDHIWRLTPDWHTLSLLVEKSDADGMTRIALERAGTGWSVDGVHRPDLDGAEEPDLSVTPLCNTLPIRKLLSGAKDSLTLDVSYIDAATMAVRRSRQRYDRLTPTRVHYTDLGVANGFEADLDLDDQGLVLTYEGLFERVDPI